MALFSFAIMDGGCDRPQYLLPDLSDAIGPVPLCRQPRPHQHRRVRGRPGTGRLRQGGHAPTEAVPMGLVSIREDVSVRRGIGLRTSRLVPCDGEIGALSPLETYTVGRRPAAVLAVPLGR